MADDSPSTTHFSHEAAELQRGFVSGHGGYELGFDARSGFRTWSTCFLVRCLGQGDFHFQFNR